MPAAKKLRQSLVQYGSELCSEEEDESKQVKNPQLSLDQRDMQVKSQVMNQNQPAVSHLQEESKEEDNVDESKYDTRLDVRQAIKQVEEIAAAMKAMILKKR